VADGIGNAKLNVGFGLEFYYFSKQFLWSGFSNFTGEKEAIRKSKKK
jgi:hypothetical protein